MCQSWIHSNYCSLFRGAVAGSNTPEATDRCEVLKEEVKDLEDYEKLIDQHKNVSRQLNHLQWKSCSEKTSWHILGKPTSRTHGICPILLAVGPTEHQEHNRGRFKLPLGVRHPRRHLRLLQRRNPTGCAGTQWNTTGSAHTWTHVGPNGNFHTSWKFVVFGPLIFLIVASSSSQFLHQTQTVCSTVLSSKSRNQVLLGKKRLLKNEGNSFENGWN